MAKRGKWFSHVGQVSFMLLLGNERSYRVNWGRWCEGDGGYFFTLMNV